MTPALQKNFRVVRGLGMLLSNDLDQLRPRIRHPADLAVRLHIQFDGGVIPQDRAGNGIVQVLFHQGAELCKSQRTVALKVLQNGLVHRLVLGFVNANTLLRRFRLNGEKKFVTRNGV